MTKQELIALEADLIRRGYDLNLLDEEMKMKKTIDRDNKVTITLTEVEVSHIVGCILKSNCGPNKVPESYIFDLCERIMKEAGIRDKIVDVDYHIHMRGK